MSDDVTTLASALDRPVVPIIVPAPREGDLDLERAKRDERVRREARRIVDDEEAGARAAQAAAQLPQPVNLADFLAVPDEDATYLIDQLWPTGGNVLLAAQYKAGKSTLLGNVLHAVADGVPFLASFDVDRPRQVTLIDDELDPRTCAAGSETTTSPTRTVCGSSASAGTLARSTSWTPPHGRNGQRWCGGARLSCSTACAPFSMP